MSDYSSLKATINANIKANNNHEITGAITNSVLNAMVDSLGAGYQFMGVATPTNPGTAQTPDYKCFYLATTPGTYTNLGGLVVADGEVAILKYDTSWTKEVTGAATAYQVSQLGQDVVLSFGGDIISIDGKCVRNGTQGLQTVSNFSVSEFIPIKPNDKFYVKVGGGNAYTAPFALFDSSFALVGTSIPYTDTTNYLYEGIYTIPSDTTAKYIVFCKGNSYTDTIICKYSIVSIQDDAKLDWLFDRVRQHSMAFDGIDVPLKTGYILADGSIVYPSTQMNWKVSDYIPVKQGDVFYLNTSGGNSSVKPYILCGGDKSLVSIGTYNNALAYRFDGLIKIDNASVKYIVFGIETSYDYQIYKFSELDKKNYSQYKEERLEFIKGNDIAQNISTNKFGTERPPYTITYKDCELYSIGHYIDNNGSLHESANLNVYKFVPPKGILGFTAYRIGGANVYGVYVLDDNTIVPIVVKTNYPNAPIANQSIGNIKEVFINVRIDSNGDVIDGIEKIEYHFFDRSYLDFDGKEYLDTSDIKYQNGYIGDNGSFVELRGYYVAKIPYDANYDYFSEVLTVAGGIYDINDNYLGRVSDYVQPWQHGSPGKNQFPISASYMLVTCPRKYWRVPKKNFYSRIHTYVQKPFEFNGKSAVFFGDSITAGFVSVPGSSQYQDFNKSWAKLLSNKVGMSATNQAIGGSALTYRANETYSSGVKLIAGPSGTRYDITEDFIFIAHGSNDWTGDIPIGKVTDVPETYEDATTFYGALNLVASTIKSLYPTKTVIFVTPIWRAEYGDFKYSLDDYRKAICDVAYRNNFNVVNGKDFGFECGSDLMIADKTHPTEMGYKMYAAQMYDRLV